MCSKPSLGPGLSRVSKTILHGSVFDQISRLTELRVCACVFRRSGSRRVSLFHHEVLSRWRMAEAAVTDNAIGRDRIPMLKPRSDAASSERLGPWLNAVASVRRPCDDTPAQCGRHDNSPDGAGKGRGPFSDPYSLQSPSKPPISGPPVRSKGWAALSVLVRTARPYRPGGT